MSDPVELTDHRAIVQAAQEAHDVAEQLDVTVQDLSLAHQKSHCIQIHVLEQEVANLRAALVALVKGIAPSKPEAKKEEIH